MKLLEQERASYAWDIANKRTEEYANMARSAPALIMSNGLMQTLAYYQNKSDQGKELVNDILVWLIEHGPLNGKVSSSKDNLFQGAMNALHEKKLTALEYMNATREALEILTWIKQFCSALEGKK